MKSETLLYNVLDRVATPNRSKRRNAFNFKMAEELSTPMSGST